MNITMPDDQVHSLNDAIARLRSELAVARERLGLFELVEKNRWRIDWKRDGTESCRILYWCDPCGMWRPVLESGDYSPSLVSALAAAGQIKLSKG